MHYANGRSAKAGDLVCGRGYNVKHDIVGLLVFANPNASACNCQVAYVGAGSIVLQNASREEYKTEDGSVRLRPYDPPSFHGVMASIEYGQLDSFVALDPETGKVLPPE